MVALKPLTFLAIALFAVSAWALPMSGEANVELFARAGRLYTGNMSWDSFVGPTACGDNLAPGDVEGKFYVGVEGELWADGNNCDKTILVFFNNGQNHTAQIKDRCTGCDINASPALFQVGANLNKGRQQASWQLQV